MRSREVETPQRAPVASQSVPMWHCWIRSAGESTDLKKMWTTSLERCSQGAHTTKIAACHLRGTRVAPLLRIDEWTQSDLGGDVAPAVGEYLRLAGVRRLWGQRACSELYRPDSARRRAAVDQGGDGDARRGSCTQQRRRAPGQFEQRNLG